MTELATSNPDYCSVIYGAGGSTRQGTQRPVQTMLPTKINAVAHLSIGGSSDAALEHIVECYQGISVARILCLRGDQPFGDTSEPAYAKGLVECLQQRFPKPFELAVAAYTKVCPDASGATDDLAHLVAKVIAGACDAITQYFYNPEAYGYFLDRCAKARLSMNIKPGIMLTRNINALQRFSAKAGADIPRWSAKSMSCYASDDKGLVDFGVE